MPTRQTNKVIRTRVGGTLDADLTKYGTADWVALNKELFGGSGTGFSLMRQYDLSTEGISFTNPTTLYHREFMRFGLNPNHDSDTSLIPQPPPLLIENTIIYVSEKIVVPGGVAAGTLVLTPQVRLGRIVLGLPAVDASAAFGQMAVGLLVRPWQVSGADYHFHDTTLGPVKNAAVNELLAVTDEEERYCATQNKAVFMSLPDQTTNDRLYVTFEAERNAAGAPVAITQGKVNVYITGKVLPSY